MRQNWPDPAFATPADCAACRAAIRQGSRSFHTASLLLPARVREPAYALYAFCRLADDAVDRGQDRHLATRQLRARLDLAYRGRPAAIWADRAFADVVQRHALPRALPEALIEGLEWDAAGRRYRDLSQLLDYAARVAGSIGVMMTVLMGVREPRVLARAADLGMAMQLTNIARDVGEDACAGRLYLPLDWFDRAGLDPQRWLREPVAHPAVAHMVQDLLLAADHLYARARPGIDELPFTCRPAIQAARQLYAAIGRRIEAHGLDSVSQRAVVPAHRKLVLVARSAAGALVWHRRDDAEAAMPEAQFLLDAVAASPPPARSRRFGRHEGRAAWAIDLLARLERRERDIHDRNLPQRAGVTSS